MPTVVGARAATGVVIAGDRLETRDGVVVSDDVERVTAIDTLILGSAGVTSAVQELQAAMSREQREHAIEHDSPLSADRLERLLATYTREFETSSLAATTDHDGTAILFQADESGAVTREDTAAIGTGAAIALGLLEQLDRNASVATVREQLIELLRIVTNRDTETGTAIDYEELLDSD